ncbi:MULTISPECIES: hypothetical protein [unclassified Nodularia (in: cyanobacteria)]|nr:MULTISPECIES: hypothetical protein [unclassified Nodularia (in: cyanobacteria)]
MEEIISNYFWLLAIALNGINALIFWVRSLILILNYSYCRLGITK